MANIVGRRFSTEVIQSASRSPNTIGPDRLANAVAVRHHYGAPAVVVDFGTAVTFDVVDRAGNYAGGIIAPGIAAMTDYLHEKTALLPRIKIRPIHTAIGKSTEQAMLIGAMHGYRGLIHSLVVELKRELKCKRLPVVATGGYAQLIAARMPEITAVEPLLILLAPFAPHLAEELWAALGHDTSIFTARWPSWDERLATAGEVEIAVQVNGKLRGRLTVPRGTAEAEVVKRALADDGVKKLADGQPVKKVVYVQDRLLNLVV